MIEKAIGLSSIADSGHSGDLNTYSAKIINTSSRKACQVSKGIHDMANKLSITIRSLKRLPEDSKKSQAQISRSSGCRAIPKALSPSGFFLIFFASRDRQDREGSLTSRRSGKESVGFIH